MKYLLFFCFFTTSIYAKWSFKSDYGQTKIYISENETRLTINFVETEKKKKEVTKDLIESLKNDKKKMLALMGVTNWKVTSQEIENKKGVSRVILTGSYTDTEGKKTYYKEFHFYSSIKKLQILLINSSKEKLEKDGVLTNISNFKDNYGF